MPGGRFVLRIPGDGTAAIIDRRVEETNARAAAAAGVAPEVIYFGADGVMLTRFVDGEPLAAESLKRDSGALERAALVLRRLHDGADVFERRFEPFAIADSYVGILVRLGRRLYEEEQATLAAAGNIRNALLAHPAQRNLATATQASRT